MLHVPSLACSLSMCLQPETFIGALGPQNTDSHKPRYCGHKESPRLCESFSLLLEG